VASVLVKAYLESFTPQTFDPEYILDAGGVGMAPVFFALLYPRATILRLDPNPSNFHIGLLNSLRLPNIKQVNLGLWDKETTLQMCDNVDIEWGPDWPFEGSQQQAYFSREPSVSQLTLKSLTSQFTCSAPAPALTG
jgi:hypothetical protein